MSRGQRAGDRQYQLSVRNISQHVITLKYSQQGQEVQQHQSHHLYQTDPVQRGVFKLLQSDLETENDLSIYGENVLTLRPGRPTRPFSPGLPASPC